MQKISTLLMYRIFLILLFLLTATAGFGQNIINKKIDYSANGLKLSDALIKLSEESKINIAFSNSIIPTDLTVDIVESQTPFKQVLKTVLSETNLSFKLVSDQVILYREDTKKLETININGYIEDADTGEKLVGANIYNPNNAYGTDSNEYGYFNFYGVPNVDSIFISYLGYGTQRILLTEGNSENILIKLKPTFFETVVVTADSEVEDFIKRPTSGVDRLDLTAIQNVISVGGEPDIFQAAYQLSGINTGADGVGGLHVRGGNLDQNLILLDGAPIYRPEHAIGVLSVFNSDAIRSAKVYKGNFPAKYGGRLSSVLDIQTKEGNNQTYAGKLSLGLLTAKATVEGPIVKNKASFFVSYRRSLTDLYVPQITNIIAEKDGQNGFSDYKFYDLNAKTNFKLGNSDRFYLSYYEGKDEFFNTRQQTPFRDSFPDVNGELLPGTFTDESNEALNWGNQMASLRWNHIFGDRIFANTTAYLTNFDFFSNSEIQSVGVYDNGNNDIILLERKFASKVNDQGIRTDIEFLASDRLNFKFGGGVIGHTISPGSSQNGLDLKGIPVLNIDSLSFRDSLELIPLKTVEAFAYYETGVSLSRQLYLTLGLHARYWSNRDADFQHTSFLPRISLDYQMNDQVALSASYLEMVQYMHLLTNSDIGLPGDIWVPSTGNVVPEQATHLQLGVQLDLKKGLEINATAYYKEMDNLIEFLESSSSNILNALNYESKVTQGVGTSKGIELEVIKASDRFNARMNYTLSKTDRQFDDLNDGNTFPYRFDLRHMFSIGGVYNINKKWSASLNWLINSGVNLTLPVKRFGINSIFQGIPPSATFVLSEKNEIQLVPNQRLDIGMNYHHKGKRFDHHLSLGIYNVYNSFNEIYIKLRRNPQDSEDLQFVSVSLLPITPSLNYSISF